MTHASSGPFRWRRHTAAFSMLLVSAAAVTVAIGAQQAPTFRSEVDYVAVDVQVVNHDGRPLPRLSADKFEVSIDGKRRRVVTADFVVNTETLNPTGEAPKGLFASNGAALGGSGDGRVFMVAIDENSL